VASACVSHQAGKRHGGALPCQGAAPGAGGPPPGPRRAAAVAGGGWESASPSGQGSGRSGRHRGCPWAVGPAQQSLLFFPPCPSRTRDHMVS